MVMWGTATAVGVLCGAVFVAGIWRDVPRGRSPLPAAWRASAVDILDIGLASYVMPLPAIVFMALAVLSARDLARLGSRTPLLLSLLGSAALAVLLVM